MSPNLDSSFPWLVNTLWILNCSSVGTRGEESAYQCRRHKTIKFDPWVGKIPRKRKWQSTPIFLPGKSHGHSLAPTPTYKGRGPPHQVILGGKYDLLLLQCTQVLKENKSIITIFTLIIYISWPRTPTQDTALSYRVISWGIWLRLQDILQTVRLWCWLFYRSGMPFSPTLMWLFLRNGNFAF